jgi:hypothetical protein
MPVPEESRTRERLYYEGGFMIINTGTKEFWLSIYFLCMGFYALCLIPLGLLKADKSKGYDWGDALNGIILFSIIIMWWYAT